MFPNKTSRYVDIFYQKSEDQLWNTKQNSTIVCDKVDQRTNTTIVTQHHMHLSWCENNHVLDYYEKTNSKWEIVTKQLCTSLWSWQKQTTLYVLYRPDRYSFFIMWQSFFQHKIRRELFPCKLTSFFMLAVICPLVWFQQQVSTELNKKVHLAGAVLEGSAGIWTRDLSHPKRESYP